MKKSWIFTFAFLCSALCAETYDVTIVGGGPAGLTSGIYASRLGLKTLIVEGTSPGGQLTTTHLVENFPGFIDGIDGPLLISNMRNQATRYNAQIKSQEVIDIDLNNHPYKLTLSNKEVVESKSVILATGSSPKLLGLSSEEALMGYGVSTCAVCDAPLYKGKDVVVVGGGDSAFEEALVLSQFATKVTLLHRSDCFRASAILRNRVNDTKNIEIKTFREVIEIQDTTKKNVERVIVLNNQTNQTEILACDGIFIAIGQSPNTSWLGDKIKLDESGMIQETPAGVFAAGDVVDQRYKQAITAAGAGCKAALNAYHYLKFENKEGK